MDPQTMTVEWFLGRDKRESSFKRPVAAWQGALRHGSAVRGFSAI